MSHFADHPNCPLPKHVDATQEPAVCWLLDVRRYGLAVANALHESDPTGSPEDKEVQ